MDKFNRMAPAVGREPRRATRMPGLPGRCNPCLAHSLLTSAGVLLRAMLLLLVITGGMGLPNGASADHIGSLASAPSSDAHFVPGEVLIGWTAGDGPMGAVARPDVAVEERTKPARLSAAATLAALTELEVLEVRPDHGTARLAVTPGREQAEILRLEALPWVTYAELNHVAFAAGLPNDPDFGQQWNMERVRAAEAWDFTTGNPSITVAVLDSGIDAYHPEFQGQLLPGWDYIEMDGEPNDAYGHGTHVSGILAAASNNGVGVAGLAPSVKILPLRVLDRLGYGTYDSIASAIEDAVDGGARIVNLSLGGTASSSRLQSAVNYALGKNALVVAAAGNCAQSNCSGLHANPYFYPAAFPGVLAVGATDWSDDWAPYSGYKPYIGIAAPGGISPRAVFSTLPGGYGYLSGTSMATPHVSAVAALIWSLNPTISNQQVTEIIEATADKVGQFPYVDGRNDYLGHGRLNAAAALRYSTQSERVWVPLLLGAVQSLP